NRGKDKAMRTIQVSEVTQNIKEMCMLQLRKANINDLTKILGICDEARQFQREQGFMQWADGYPSTTVIDADISASRGYMISMDGSEIGYCVIDTTGDAEYDRLHHIWQSQDKYAAIHRLALCNTVRGKGLGSEIFEVIENYIIGQGFRIIKVDTGVENVRMQRILTNLGYNNLGTHIFVWGPRIAFEKVI
ncbi:MAG: GNAT family N-acetyltransferase, partial [Muribaculaceae bacterium]|nr:GNAT family N-acetyltransferase [Muribaculaceae bacterium]